MAHPEHRVYPYLLRGLAIERPNQAWATDITYVPLARGFMYLVAILDWASRKVRRLAGFQQPGQQLLCGSLARGPCPLWEARDLQHR